MQEKGLKLLVNLSFASEEASQEMVQAGTIPLVLQSIERDFSATEVQIKGLWVLKNLTHYRDGCTAVVAAGGVRVAALSMATNLPMIKLVEQVNFEQLLGGVAVPSLLFIFANHSACAWKHRNAGLWRNGCLLLHVNS